MATFDKASGAGTLRLVVTQSSQNKPANTSVVAWSLYLLCSNGTSWNSDGTAANVVIGGTTAWSGSFGFDFRGSTSKLIASGTRTVTHNAQGFLTLAVSGYIGDTGTIAIGTPGTVTGSLVLTRIPKVPSAPTGGILDTITPTSMRYRFTAGADNGASITQYRIQVATASNFAGATTVTVTGTTNTLPNLTPSTLYYVRAQAYNSAGWGAYSATATATTMSGAYRWTGTKWAPCEVLARTSAGWKSAEVFGYQSDWTPAA